LQYGNGGGDMTYDTTIRTETTTSRVTTRHVDFIDWDGYDFYNPKHRQGFCCSKKEGNVKQIEEKILYLWEIDANKDHCMASNYGGWPRIFKQVMCVGMVSSWPYWEPRPSVMISGTLGGEWYDWAEITGVQITPERTT